MDIKDIIGKKVAVWCKTEQEAKGLFKLFRLQGLTFGMDNKCSENKTLYHTYGPDTCYECSTWWVTYAQKAFFSRDDYTILPASDFLQPPPLDPARRGFDYPYWPDVYETEDIMNEMD